MLAQGLRATRVELFTEKTTSRCWHHLSKKRLNSAQEKKVRSNNSCSSFCTAALGKGSVSSILGPAHPQGGQAWGRFPACCAGQRPSLSPLCPISRLPHALETTTPSSLRAIVAARATRRPRPCSSPPPPAKVRAKSVWREFGDFGFASLSERASE